MYEYPRAKLCKTYRKSGFTPDMLLRTHGNWK